MWLNRPRLFYLPKTILQKLQDFLQNSWLWLCGTHSQLRQGCGCQVAHAFDRHDEDRGVFAALGRAAGLRLVRDLNVLLG